MDETEETTVRTYASSRAFDRGQQEMAKEGWHVRTTTTHQPRQGIGRIAILGFFGAFLFKPKAQIVVTYARTRGASEQETPGGPSFGDQVQAKVDARLADTGMPPGLSIIQQARWLQEHKKKDR